MAWSQLFIHSANNLSGYSFKHTNTGTGDAGCKERNESVMECQKKRGTWVLFSIITCVTKEQYLVLQIMY